MPNENMPPALAAILKAAFEAGRQSALQAEDATAAPRTSPPEGYKVNSDGKPEFASVVITLDHLLLKDNGHFTVKHVFSTETAEAALRSLLDYYDEDNAVFRMESTIDQLSRYRQDPENGIFLYIPNEPDKFGNPFVQAILSTAAYAKFVQHEDFGEGSQFLAVQRLVAAFETALTDVKKALGAYPPLTFMVLSEVLKADPQAQ